MRTVAGILGTKGAAVWTISPDSTVRDALETLAEQNIGALVVVDGGDLVGIMSERDYARRVEIAERHAADVLVSEIMTPNVVTVGPEDRAESCLGMMTEYHIRHLPVVSGDEMIGLVSIGDVVKAVIDDLTALVDQLEAYITGR
jgi:CBS domain-containing protein